MKRNFRVLVLPLVLSTALLAAACGGDDDGDGGNADTVADTVADTSAPTDETNASDDTAAEDTVAPVTECDDSDPIEFGALYSLTGPAADIGALAKDGVSMALEDVNAAGGVLGRCVELILKDDAGDPTKAAQAVRELVDQEEVDVMLGPFLSSPVAATLEVTTPANLLHITQSALTAAADPELYPYSFTNENNSGQIVQAMVNFVEDQGWTKAGIVAVNNAYGTQSIELFEAAIEGTDIEIAGSPQLHESGKADLNAEVSAVVEAGAEVIMIFNVAGPDQTATIRARNQQAPELPMVGSSALFNASTTDNFTVEELDNVYGGPAYTALGYLEGTTEALGENAAAFLARYREYKGVDVLDVSASQAAGAYDGLMMAAAAINGVGSTDDPEALREWFHNNSYAGVRATYTWSESSHGGVPPDQTSFMKIKSLLDGLTQLAPGEG